MERSKIELIQLRGGSGVAPDCGMGVVARILHQRHVFEFSSGDGSNKQSCVLQV